MEPVLFDFTGTEVTIGCKVAVSLYELQTQSELRSGEVIGIKYRTDGRGASWFLVHVTWEHTTRDALPEGIVSSSFASDVNHFVVIDGGN